MDTVDSLKVHSQLWDSIETVATSSWQRVKLAGSEAGPCAPRQHAAKLCTMLLIGQSTSRTLHKALIKFGAGAEI